MRELEKILEEIDKATDEYGMVDYINDEPVISKNQAKDIIRKHMNDGQCGECSRRKWYQKGYEDGEKDNDGWIPVEKDLPKNESTVWVVLESISGSGYRTYSSARYLYFENYGESHWCDNNYGYLEWDKYSDGRGGCSLYKVVAWMPIEPYRPERSEEE